MGNKPKTPPKEEVRVIIGMPSRSRTLYQQEWAKANPEKVAAAQKKYRVKNREKVSERYRSWYYSNQGRILERRREYRIEHPEVYKEIAERFRTTMKGRFNSMKGGAKTRGLEVRISIKDFERIVIEPCVYCDEKEIPRGIDRVDNSIGYLIENCASCCPRCNIMKRDMSVADFTKHLKRIVNHLKI